MLIESGIGNGKLAGVDSDNRLLTVAFNVPFEHLLAKDYNKTFMVEGTATAGSSSVSVLLVRNDSESDIVVLNRVFLTSFHSGGTAVPNSGAFFTLETEAVYAAGGTPVAPVNLSSGSSVVSNVSGFEGNATLAGQPKVAMTAYPAAVGHTLDMDIKGGVLILPGKAMSIGYTSDATGGLVQASVAFSVVGAEGYSG